jgi:membrane fusion protein, multidrug efflux system
VGRRQYSADHGRCLSRSDITPLSAKIAGYIRRVPVNNFQQVKEGDLLVKIEDDDCGARVEEAEAELAGTDAALRI